MRLDKGKMELDEHDVMWAKLFAAAALLVGLRMLLASKVRR